MMWQIGLGAELETTTKMESENESENDLFCKMGGCCHSAKMLILALIFVLILGIIFKKGIKNEN
jgi:hypothetical protein